MAFEIWASRNFREIKETIRWLSKNELHSIPLRSRTKKDFRPALELKEDWINECINNNCVPDIVFENRIDVGQMFSSKGVQVTRLLTSYTKISLNPSGGREL